MLDANPSWTDACPARFDPIGGAEVMATSLGQGRTSCRWTPAEAEDTTSVMKPPVPTIGCGPAGSTVNGSVRLPNAWTSGTPFSVTVVSTGGAFLSRLTITRPGEPEVAP